MRKLAVVAALAAGLSVLATSPALADTVTRTVQVPGFTISCVVTYTDLNGDGMIDSVDELRSITDVRCTITKNT